MSSPPQSPAPAADAIAIDEDVENVNGRANVGFFDDLLRLDESPEEAPAAVFLDEEVEETEEEEEEKPVIPSLVENDDKIAKLSDVAVIMKLWEERVAAATNGPYNPVSILTRLSEIIEYEALEYLKLDPDPFDDRHPSRTHPSCSVGTSLKALFKKEVFMTKLVHEYLKEHWGEEWDLAVNTSACRLFVNILPGLETSVVYQETEGLIQRLFVWAETAPEPLKSYSLGLLGASMEIPEIAGKFKEKNIHLVQLMLKRLRDLQNEFFGSQHKALTHRSFSQFSSTSSVSLRPIVESPQTEEILIRPIRNGGTLESNSTTTEPKLINGLAHNSDMVDSPTLFSTPPGSQIHTPVKHHRPISLSLNEMKDELANLNGVSQTPSTPKTPSAGLNLNSSSISTPKSSKKSRSSLTPGKHFLQPTIQNRAKRRKLINDPDLDDCSTSSSWAELEPNIIGQWQVFPVNLVTRQIFTLRYLAPLGEYQEMLGYAFEHNAIQIILRYLSKSNQTKETSRLTFEALKYLGALLCHKKFALEFLQAGGLQRLLQVPRPSLSATGVSLCLYYIAYSEDAMEKVCLMSKTALSNLIAYVLWLLECSHSSGRNHAIMFFGVIYPFKIMLDLFDAQDGLRAILNVITTQPTFVQIRKNIEGRRMPPEESVNEVVDGIDDADLSEEDQMLSRQSVRQISFNLKRYFECHLGFTADKLKRTIGKSHANNVTGPVLPPYKALKPCTALDLASLHFSVSSLLPENAQRWAPVDRFLNQTGIEMIMQTIAMAYEWNYSGRGETVRNMLDVLSICSLIPRTQVLLTDRFKINGTSEHSGLSIVLSAAEGEVVNEPDVKKSALQVIGNCVCGPMHHKKPSETQTKVWECTRVNNGILILTRLLQTKSPITDADSIRAMACWCLSGLARYRHVRQVLQQLPLIRSGLIQNLMTEPILQDKRHDHAMFQKYAMEIIKLVHGKEETFNFELGDLIRKSDLISQSKIDYYESDLTELIHDHLIKAGLTETAAVLQMESRSKQSSAISNVPSTAPISLDKIVRQYLVNQHSLCKSPMIVCPTFQLLKPHKCPSKSDRPKVIDKKMMMGTNVCSRTFNREMFGGGGSTSGGHEDRKLIYSRFKPVRVLRSADVTGDDDMSFTTCAFSSCYQWTIVGTSTGDVKLFNNSNTQEDGTYLCHDSEIYHLQPNTKGSLLLTSNIWRRPLSALWRMEGLFDKVMDFERDEYVEFSKVNQDKVITTNGETASIYDIETKMKLMSLRPKMSNQYLKNRATFDPYDELILSDGVLWDFKSGKEVHKFDKLNENLSGVFNPKNGIEIIANTEIWDVRTFHLLKTVRQLDQCLLTFTNDASVIYGVKIEREEHPSGDGTVAFRHADTSFVVIDNLDDYSSIATIELKRHIMSLATSPNDLQLALIENHTTMDDTLANPDSCVRFYEVGRTRVNELSNTDGVDDDDDVQSDDDADVDDDDDDDDDDEGDDSNSDDDDEEIAADNDLDRLLDELLPPNELFMNNENEDDSSSSSWEEEDDGDSDDSSEENDSDSE